MRVPLNRASPVETTLGIMRTLIRRDRDDRNIRDQALKVTQGCVRLDDRCRMIRLLGFVKNVVPYEKDVAGVETLHTPTDQLERIRHYGNAGGDCDDAAMLLAALLMSLGIQVRLVALSVRPDRVLHHVAVEARDGRSGWWVYVDPFRSYASDRGMIGQLPKFTRILRLNV